MPAPTTPAEMMAYVLMVSTNTHVSALMVTMVITVNMVSNVMTNMKKNEHWVSSNEIYFTVKAV